MAFPVPTPRFPLLGKIVAIVLVLLALTIALQAVSGIVAEREGRLREAEASVAASLASSQTLLGPILQRNCTETWETVQGEGKERKVVTERRSWKLAAAPAKLDVSAQVALEPRYRGIFKVNGYVMKATLAATWPDGSALVPKAEHAGSRLGCEPPQVLLALGDSRGVRSANVRVDGSETWSCRAPATRRTAAASMWPSTTPMPVRRSRSRCKWRSSWSAPASWPSPRSANRLRWSWRPTGRIRRSPAASCRSSGRSRTPAFAPPGS